ncbi:MAG: DUF4397 domain-containing protein [Lachnospiraceae bacterium]|nr:DUF4397 domain-containing protein [Lachnospiraceae bacterium]
MYIDHEEWNHSPSNPESDEKLSALETPASEVNGMNDPGYAPISPETPSWGPPSGTNNGTTSDPGFAPISPETPSWGPPSGTNNGTTTDPGFAPISPETPSWGPPSGTGGSTSGGIGGSIGGTITIPPVIVIPGQPTFPSRPTTQYANIRFLHAAPNQPAVNIRLGNRTVINNMQFANSTPYYLETGNQRILITITNTRNGITLYRGYLYFTGQTAYTVSIVDSGSGISLYTITDTPCSRTNYGCLRAVNLSPNSGAVDIFLSGYGRIFQRINQFSYTGYRLISQGSYRASVSEALPCTSSASITMTEDYVECSNTRIAIMDTTTLTIMNGVTYTLYIIGLAYQFPSLQLLPLESDLIY